MSARKIGLIFAFIVGMTLLYFTIHQFASPLLPESHGWEVIASKFDADVVRVPAGEFVMGSDSGRSDERPQHPVYLDAFEIDRDEVTNAQYWRFLKYTGRTSPRYWSGGDYPMGQANYPVVGVSWDDADAYCAWAGKRLPTEAEWERSCRGPSTSSGDARIYPWGDAWDAMRANVDVSVHAAHPDAAELLQWDDAWALLRATPAPRALGLRPIGSFPESASPYGVMDLVGNASEWVADWYNWSDYSAMPAQNPRGLGPPWNHSVRGSAWYDPQGAKGWAQEQSRCSARNSSHETQDPRTGFRCAR